jgi:hypothetical protein
MRTKLAYSVALLLAVLVMILLNALVRAWAPGVSFAQWVSNFNEYFLIGSAASIVVILYLAIKKFWGE